jgi:hypothetical protein
MPSFPNDTSIQSIFEHAKKGRVENQEVPVYYADYATYVEHHPNTHAPGGDYTGAVFYGHGRLALSSNKKKLTGEFKYGEIFTIAQLYSYLKMNSPTLEKT